MKLLVLIGASGGPLYGGFVENWKKVQLPPNVKLYFTYSTEDGQTTTELRNGNEIYFPFKRPADGVDIVETMSHAMRMQHYRWALENEEFDVVLAGTCSSAFRFKKMLEWLSTKPMTNHCFGRRLWNDFPSGCGYILTRDVVERIVKWTPPRVWHDDLTNRDFINATGVSVIEWELDHEAHHPQDRLWVFIDPYTTSHFHLRFKTSFKVEERGKDVVNHLNVITYWNEQDM